VAVENFLRIQKDVGIGPHNLYRHLMSDLVCDIGQQDVVISDNRVTCAGVSDTPAKFVGVFGATTRHNLSVTGSDVVLELRGVSIVSDSPVSLVGSTVQVVYMGSNSVTSNSSLGVLCGGRSNISFFGGD
jgi:hypothetical protein